MFVLGGRLAKAGIATAGAATADKHGSQGPYVVGPIEELTALV